MFEVSGYMKSKKVQDDLINNKLVEKWSNLTEGLTGQNKEILSSIIENQHLINQFTSDDSVPSKSDFIEMTSVMYGSLLQLGICHVVPMMGPEEEICGQNFKTATRKFDYKYNYKPDVSRQEDESQYFRNILDLASIKYKFRFEIFNEIVKDLSSTCLKTNCINSSSKDVQKSTVEFFNAIFKDKCEIPEWMVVSENTAKHFIGKSLFCGNAEKVGVFRWANEEIPIIVSPEFEDNRILFGRKDCYVHAAYVPVTKGYPVIDPETKLTSCSFYTRYSKKLISSKGIYILDFAT